MAIYYRSGNTNNSDTGRIVQVKIGTRSTVFSTTSSSYQDVVSESITPHDSGNKILIFCTLHTAGTDNNAQRLIRGGTVIFCGTGVSSRAAGMGGSMYDGHMGDTAQQNNGGVFLDSPNTTSATTYKLQVAASGGGTVYCGRDVTDNNNGQHTRNMQTLVLMEVAQ